MTTENQLDVIQNLDKDEVKNEIPTNNEEIPVQQPIASLKVEDEQINIEKPKRAGRKKRDLTAISDVKTENFNNDMDTQPLFEQPVIIEGKRSRKPTSRLELSDLATPKKELSIPQVNIHVRLGCVRVHTYFKNNLLFNLFLFRVMESHWVKLNIVRREEFLMHQVFFL
jgi:hypothetical protein